MSKTGFPARRDVLVPIITVAVFLLLSSFMRWPLAIPLLIGTLLTITMSWQRQTLPELWQGLWQGIVATWPVLIIMCLVGALTGLWMGTGTTGAMIAAGLQFAQPDWFILTCFLGAAAVSMLLGSAVGTLSTIGLAFTGIATSLNQPLALVAGALVSGALLGDRSALVSSNFHLAIAQTEAQIMPAWRLAWQRLLPTATVCLLSYSLAGRVLGGAAEGSAMLTDLWQGAATIEWPMLIPPALVLVLAAVRTPVRLALVGGLLTAAGQGLLAGSPMPELLTWIWSGAFSVTPFGQPLHGGGIQALLPIIGIIIAAAAFAGSYEGSGLLAGLVAPLVRSIRHPVGLARKVTLVSLATAAIACNQTLAVLLPARMFRHEAKRWHVPSTHVAVTLLDSGGIAAALIPWNQFAIICGAVIGLSPLDYAPYALLPWLLLATSLFRPLGNSSHRTRPAMMSEPGAPARGAEERQAH